MSFRVLLSPSSPKYETFSLLRRLGSSTDLQRVSPNHDETYNSLLGICLEQCKLLKTRKVFDEMPQRTVHASRIGKAVHTRSLTLGIDSRGRLSNAVVDLYAKCKEIAYAEKVFDSLEKDVTAWNSMLSMYSSIGLPGKVLRSFVSLFKGLFFPNKFTFSIVLSTCARDSNVEFGRQIHCCMVKTGFERNSYCGGALVDMYAKCDCIGDARQVFDEILDPNTVCWTCLFSGYVKAGLPEEAVIVFEKMRGEGHRPDHLAFVTVINTYISLGKLKDARVLFGEMASPDVVAWNVMISGHGKRGCESVAVEYFLKLPSPKSIVLWTGMMSGHSQNGFYEEALKFYKEMRQDGALPDQATFVTVLRVCSVLSSLREGRAIHSLTFHLAHDLDELTSNTLIDMYAKCGDMKSSSQVFDEMKRRSNVVSWNSIINGYAKNGYAEDALKIFDSMRQSRITPDEITFLGVLTACSHAGRVSEGRKIFEMMISQYGIEARVDHVACMVDLVGRWGYLEEAVDFLEAQNLKPDARVWSSLLGACSIHGDDIRGEMAAEKLIELEPENSSAYVLLSNIYASQGRWEKVNALRKDMKDRGVSKVPGCSWIDVGERKHVFGAGDKSHSDICKIETFLEDIYDVVKDDAIVNHDIMEHASHVCI
ncbi:hypothetical protein DY000_02003851 [Brassica cretica]|uniref:Pentacotripeptide-repeat region of PRORP domain-containing protein n=1 Tax=Brassica cretica TaxID=69181 RepID=A0ABQ7BVG5_BRACR|nr:hypothetical protein DY000_02003851 [Brassica cretica]